MKTISAVPKKYYELEWSPKSGVLEELLQFCTACSSSGLANVSYEINRANRSKVFHATRDYFEWYMKVLRS